MNGIILVNKPSGITSRDVVNKACKIFNTKKIGHTGTLDPIASGVLVLCVGPSTKLVEELTALNKEYIATVKLGVLTDTLDVDGTILKEEKISITEEQLKNTLNSFIGTYDQEAPIYSAIKINGKKLYEYARNGEEVTLPKRKVSIYSIELLELNDEYYKFKVKVSKGTYIRSLIKDINDKLGIIGSMSGLIRTKQGDFKIEESYTLEDLEKNNYKLLTVNDILLDNESVNVDNYLYERIKNGNILDNRYNKEKVVFVYNGNVIAIYKTYEKDNTKIKPYKMFLNKMFINIIKRVEK